MRNDYNLEQGFSKDVHTEAPDHANFEGSRATWVYLTPWSLFTTWPVPLSTNLVVSRPSTPTGPRAWIRPVLMPTYNKILERSRLDSGKGRGQVQTNFMHTGERNASA